MRDETVLDSVATASAATSPEKPKPRRPVVVIFFIACWFLANGTTVLLNKYIFKFLGFRFPLSLTLIHMVIQSILAHLTVDYLKTIEKIHVERSDYYSKLLVISVVFCLNICLGNVSLRYVPVSFMQTIKSLTPVCTALLQFLVFRSRLTTPAMLALIPVTTGVALASATELQFHLGGFIAALVACFLTGTKFVLSRKCYPGGTSSIALICCTIWHRPPPHCSFPSLPILNLQTFSPGYTARCVRMGTFSFYCSAGLFLLS